MRKVKGIVFSMTNKCAICGSSEKVATHEIFFGTANRKKSIEDGMVVNLCGKHHNLSSEGVHFDKDLDLQLKRKAQKKWEEVYGNRELFIKRYGRNYLSD